MIHLKNLLNEQQLRQDQIKWLNKCAPYTKWKLTQAGLVDIFGDFDCQGQYLLDFEGVSFGTITGYFNCGNNQLTSLKGAPKKVVDFYCYSNQLTSLAGAPRIVTGEFDCSDNKLSTLEGAPRKVGGDFNCKFNQLTSLKGAPLEVGGDFKSHQSKGRLLQRYQFQESDIRNVSNVSGTVYLYN